MFICFDYKDDVISTSTKCPFRKSKYIYFNSLIEFIDELKKNNLNPKTAYGLIDIPQFVYFNDISNHWTYVDVSDELVSKLPLGEQFNFYYDK